MARRAQRCRLRRHDIARTNAIALDVPVAEFRSDVLRQHLETAFRRCVRRHRLAPHFAEHRADIDDLAVAFAQHAGQNSLRDDERRRQIDVNDLAEIRRLHLEHRRAFDDACIVHKNVDGAERLFDIGNHLAHRSLVRDITEISMRLDAVLLVVRQCLVHVRLTAAVERNLRARVSICLRNRIADTIRAACHQCDLARQRELFRDIKHHSRSSPSHSPIQPSFRKSADSDLAHLHRLQRILVALRRHASTARRIDRDRHLREGRLENHRIRNHTDVRAEPDKLNLIRLQPRDDLWQLQRAKGRLLHDSRRLLHKRLQRRRNLPSLLRLDAVSHRQVLPLLRLQVPRTMRVLREHQ